MDRKSPIVGWMKILQTLVSLKMRMHFGQTKHIARASVSMISGQGDAIIYKLE